MLKISLFFPVILLILSFALTLSQNPSDDLSLRLNLIVEERQLSGLQLKVTKNGQGIFYHDRGIKNTKNEPIDNRTMFIVASLSKSVVGVGILQLVEKGLIKLNDPISKIFGFAIKNPNFPNVDITVYMLLCHYSSIG
jgi:D-alanyl-D-alanine carboxypeptidase